MDSKLPLSPPVLIGAVVVFLGLVGFIAMRSFGGGGGSAAVDTSRTVAPVEQKYPDGTPVPYNAAPAGAIPGNPASVSR